MHERQLSDRDYRILDFLARYRVGTPVLIGQACFAPGHATKNVERVLRRLAGHGLVKTHVCGPELKYSVLTARGCSALELTPRTPRRFTEQSLPSVLAVATYCVSKGYSRLTCAEFKQLYPELWAPGMRSSNYVLSEGPDGVKLSLLLVDRGGAARRIRTRVRRVIAQRKKLPAFVSLIGAGCFGVTVLTATDEQRTKIMRHAEQAEVNVSVEVVNELAEILLWRRD